MRRCASEWRSSGHGCAFTTLRAKTARRGPRFRRGFEQIADCFGFGQDDKNKTTDAPTARLSIKPQVLRLRASPFAQDDKLVLFLNFAQDDKLLWCPNLAGGQHKIPSSGYCH